MKTRKFIFGMFLLIICGTATVLHIVQIYNHIWPGDLFNWVIFIFCCFGCVVGVKYVSETI